MRGLNYLSFVLQIFSICLLYLFVHIILYIIILQEAKNPTQKVTFLTESPNVMQGWFDSTSKKYQGPAAFLLSALPFILARPSEMSLPVW